MVASRLHIRLFIDGIEVPVIGARTTHSEGSPATAQIQVVATDEVYDLLPRSLVTLFYYESYDYEKPVSPSATAKRLGPRDLRRWKLLYMGELVGVTFQKDGSKRAATLLAADPTNYWDFIKQHYVNFSQGGIELFENAFLGVKQDRVKNFDVITKDVNSNLYVWLTQSKVKDEETGETYSSIYLGVQRVLREMFFAANNFYSGAYNRLRLGDQIVGLPQDRTAARLMKLDYFQKFVKNLVGGSGGLVSARQMVETLLGTVLHTYVTVPCPMFDLEGKARGYTVKSSDEIAADVVPRDTLAGSSLNYTVIKPDTWFLAPPLCNVVFPHQYSTLSYQRSHLQEPTRLFLRTSLFFTGANKHLTERFYAPDFEEFNQQLYRTGGYLKRMSSVLLEHEKFVGLNPAMVWQNDLGAYVQSGPRHEYLSRLTDYLYWKYRFATRVVNVSGPFNPELVPGYPALVMDRVGPPGSSTRHFMGNIQTLVHSVDQTGGWTHFTMVAARPHDETADFDGEGRSLEQVTSRGTDGFLDDRYDFGRIGQDVYPQLFGVGSLSEVLSDLQASADSEELQASIEAALTISTGDTRLLRAVAVLQHVYRLAVSEGADMGAFTKALTQRPKANLVDIMGVPPTLGLGLEEDEATALRALYAELRASRQTREGFMSIAVDTTATDLANDHYEFTTERRIKEVVPDTEGQASVSTRVVSTTRESGSFGLKDQLEQRQARVQAYLDSLRTRGLRG